MYPYTAGGTGLTACLPPWVQEGGFQEFVKRLRDETLKKQIIMDMKENSGAWENFNMVGASNIIPSYFLNEKLQKYAGKSIKVIAREKQLEPEETIINLIIEDESRVETIYHSLLEENVIKGLKQPWVSLGSDGSSVDPEGDGLKLSDHPRTFGTFARFLGRYVRDKKITTLEDAIRRLTYQPASNLNLSDRGLLRENYYADIVVFDPKTIQDHATFENPLQLATGVSYVFVNGVMTLENGEHTGKFGGKYVKNGFVE
jgi:N-acyl-D-amino-acid deacylase